MDKEFEYAIERLHFDESGVKVTYAVSDGRTVESEHRIRNIDEP